MKLRNSLFLLLVLPFVSQADYTAFRYYFRPQNFTTGFASDHETFPEDASGYVNALAFSYSKLPLQLTDSGVLTFDLIGQVAITSATTSVKFSTNHAYYKRYTSLCSLVSTAISRNFVTVSNVASCAAFIYKDNTYTLRDVSSDDFFNNVFKLFTASQLADIVVSLPMIQSDVASIVPSLDSHAATVSNLASSLDREFHAVSNLQSSANSYLDTIARSTSYFHDINQYSSLIYDKVCELVPWSAPGATVALTFASVYGMDGYPYEALVDAGLASDLYDAQNKCSDQNWVHQNLPGAISAQIEKNALIQQFQRDGISPPAGTSFRNLGLQQLRNIASYSYNTPVSSNVTLNAKSLEYLKHLNDNSDDINSGVQSLRDTLQSPQEVIVLNWPTDIYGGANLSNLFADAIQGFQAAWTNFNPVYTWSDGTFFERSFYNWRGLNTLEFSGHGNPDQLEIGISSFSFSPTGNFFNDVPNLIALQGRVSMDVANMVGLVAAYTQTNLNAMSSTQSLENQYQEEFLQQATESLNEFSNALSSSNLLERNTRFIDTSSVFSTPAGFTEIFSGDHSIPSHINLQLPSWHFGQDDQSTPDTGSTITIETAQYATFFQNCRYVFLFLYWGITVMIMIWLFRLFSRFISWIPLSLTGGGSHDTVSI